jgi:hypothetical protein
MSSIAFDIAKLYDRQFGLGRYHVTEPQPANEVNSYTADVNANTRLYSKTGSPLYAKDAKGVEIWLPTKLYNLWPVNSQPVGKNGELELPYSTISITGGATIIRTPLAERKGSAKEVYNIEDYKITIKGFFIDKENRSLPEYEIEVIKKILETGKPIGLYNAISDIILADDSNPGFEQQQVLCTRISLPEVSGGRTSMRPFLMEFESDNIFTLEVE